MDVDEAIRLANSDQWSAGRYAQDVALTLAVAVLNLRGELALLEMKHRGVINEINGLRREHNLLVAENRELRKGVSEDE